MSKVAGMLALVAALLLFVVGDALAPWPRRGHDNLHTGASTLSGAIKGVLNITLPTDGGPISTSPVIDNDGTVYLATEGGLVLALNRGVQRWNATLPPLTKGTHSSGTIIGSAALFVIPSHNGTVFAYDLANGKLQWTYVHPLPTEISSAIFDETTNTIYWGANLGLVAIDTKGVKLWANDSYSKVYSTPSLLNGLLYFGCIRSQEARGDLWVLNASTGYAVSRWTLPGYSWIIASISISTDHGMLIVCANGGSGSVYGFNVTNTTSPAWSFSNYSVGDGVTASPALSNGVAYIVSGYGRISALDIVTGVPLWIRDLYYTAPLGNCFASPALDGAGALYVACRKSVLSLSAKTGALLWNYTTPSLVTTYSSPAIGDGYIVLGTGSGDVLTFV